MFVMFWRVCTHVRLGILANSLCGYVCVVADGMYTYKTCSFGKSTYIYVYVVVEGMYTCKTWNFGKEYLCLYIRL